MEVETWRAKARKKAGWKIVTATVRSSSQVTKQQSWDSSEVRYMLREK